MSIYRLKSLCIIVFKMMDDLNPSFMNDIFHLRIDGPVRTQNANNITVETRKTFTFGTKSISSLGPKIWNILPSHIKFCESVLLRLN